MFLPPCFSMKDFYRWLAISLLSVEESHRGTSKGFGWEAESKQEMVGRTLGVIWDSWRGRWEPSTSQQVSFSSLATHPQCPKAPAVSEFTSAPNTYHFLGRTSHTEEAESAGNEATTQCQGYGLGWDRLCKVLGPELPPWLCLEPSKQGMAPKRLIHCGGSSPAWC